MHTLVGYALSDLLMLDDCFWQVSRLTDGVEPAHDGNDTNRYGGRCSLILSGFSSFCGLFAPVLVEDVVFLMCSLFSCHCRRVNS